MQDASLLLIVAVLLPPASLELLGPVVEERTVATPYGEVGPMARRCLDESTSLWIQPYTGSSVRTDPRATIAAATALGVKRILCWDRAIAVNQALQRGQTALVSDYVDWTKQLPSTMLEDGSRTSSLAQSFRPICAYIAKGIQTELPQMNAAISLGVDGNRRETVAEARIYRSWQIDVISHNLVPEVVLASEANLCFAGLVTVSDVSADRAPAPAAGELRQSLSMITSALPNIVRHIVLPHPCHCRTSHD